MKMSFEDTMISILIDGVERIGCVERLEKLSAALKGFEMESQLKIFENWQSVEMRGQIVCDCRTREIVEEIGW